MKILGTLSELMSELGIANYIIVLFSVFLIVLLKNWKEILNYYRENKYNYNDLKFVSKELSNHRVFLEYDHILTQWIVNFNIENSKYKTACIKIFVRISIEYWSVTLLKSLSQKPTKQFIRELRSESFKHLEKKYHEAGIPKIFFRKISKFQEDKNKEYFDRLVEITDRKHFSNNFIIWEKILDEFYNFAKYVTEDSIELLVALNGEIEEALEQAYVEGVFVLD